ncbi:BTAD domain-containing putative transcriptional regulator [Rhodococcus sp. NPDC003318]|uniref:AfsR/SARP family transcriptional regulator n=1 Tax=Rhodococcus sp. NPDC003318 TaxID=3364503 RepID=UPI0036C6E8AF
MPEPTVPTTTPPPSVYLQVLGPVRVLVGDTDVSIGGPVPRALLSRLAIVAGETVTDDALIDDLWGDAPPRTAKLTLQGYVARMRKVLDPHRPGARSRILVRRGNGYALEPDATDWQQFVSLTATGRALLAAGDAEAAAAALDGALDHWLGDAYADVTESDAVAIEARRLDTLRLDAVEDRMEAGLGLGEFGSVAAQLDSFTRRHPLRERAWELLARAHYLAGRPGEALDALRRARTVLAEELGTDPRPSLLALQTAILEHDDALVSVSTVRPAAAASQAPTGEGTGAPDPFAHNIPLALTSLVGRAGQLEDLTELLRTYRLVTLTGSGGMGKTRLALELARGRTDPDGPWLVELAGARDADQVTDALCTALGLTVSGGVDGVTEVLRGRTTLLVLDNCEQVVEPVAGVVTALLSRCPSIRIVATSREALFAAGEFVYEVPPLSGGEDVELFVERAAAQLGSFAPDDQERDLLTRLCAELDGMPLAIELAAAQCRTLSVRQLIAHVDDRFALLRGGPRTTARHTTMLAAVEWSYQTLTEPEQRLFQSLAVFEGGFEFDAAREVVGDADLLANLASLVDKSLVSVIGGDPRRYRMLETMRDYAARVRDPELTAQLRRAHTRWVCDLADAAFLGLRGPDSSRWMHRMELDIANVRAALDHNADDAETYLRIAGGVYWYWYRGGHVAEAIRWLAPAMPPHDGRVSPAGLPVLARAVAGAVVIHYLAGDLPGVFTAFGLLTELAVQVTEPVSRADAETTLAFFEAGSGLIEQARAHARASLDFGVRSGHPFTAAEALMCLGTADFRAGDLDDASAHLDESVAVANGCGYSWCEASSLWIGAKVDLARDGRGGTAEAKLARMVRVCEDSADVTSWLVALATLAYAAFRRGDHETAAVLTGVVDSRGAAIGYRPAAMDPVDLARYDAELRAGVAGPVLESGRAAGAAMTRAQVSELVTTATRDLTQ